MDTILRLHPGSNSDRRLVAYSKEGAQAALLLCLPTLEKALASTDEIDIQSLAALIRTGKATLLVEFVDDHPQACAVACVMCYPLYNALEILAIAGFPNRRPLGKEGLILLKDYADALGCEKIQGYVNEAVGRLWKRIGFYEARRLMRIDL